MSALFTPRPIGYARTPFTQTSAVPKGPGTKHEADGTIEILPEFEQVWPTSKAFRISTCCGFSISPRDSS